MWSDQHEVFAKKTIVKKPVDFTVIIRPFLKVEWKLWVYVKPYVGGHPQNIPLKDLILITSGFRYVHKAAAL